ncbi:MAG: DNA-deoxyinosine glycosylase [Massilia sp.]|nr:DNA-deoxyinosine glycosylase [Massilia sp.]MDB5791642.1 DNA-deoxyinosine glycosylase [Massilia sp.]
MPTSSPPARAALLTGLEPVLSPTTRVLVLGSFPGAQSLAAAQYYAHPRNQFWRLLSAVIGEDLTLLSYAERLPRLLAHDVGLWDVLAACEREGSLDSAIRRPAANDFERLRELCPLLETVGFNGQASGKFAQQFEAAGYRTVVLPSSSPAHMAMTFEQKLQVWRRLADARTAPSAPPAPPAQSSLF